MDKNMENEIEAGAIWGLYGDLPEFIVNGAPYDGISMNTGPYAF